MLLLGAYIWALGQYGIKGTFTMIIALSVVVNHFKRAPNLVKTQMGGRRQVPPLRLRHCV